jgi:hypothetical protein
VLALSSRALHPRLKGWHGRPPLRTSQVDQLLGVETGARPQVGEVPLRRAGPDADERRRLRERTARCDEGGEDVDPAAVGVRVSDPRGYPSLGPCSPSPCLPLAAKRQLRERLLRCVEALALLGSPDQLLAEQACGRGLEALGPERLTSDACRTLSDFAGRNSHPGRKRGMIRRSGAHTTAWRVGDRDAVHDRTRRGHRRSG